MGLFARSMLPLALALLAHRTEAANLLVNPDFDQANGLLGWTWDGGNGEINICGGGADCGNMHYSASECCSKPNSGSVASNSSFFYTETLTQCVANIAANTAYDFGIWMRLTTASGLEPGLPGVIVDWYASADCAGQAIGITASNSTESATWTRVAIPGPVAPTGTQSAKFRLIAGATGDSGTSVGMEFDSAFFGPAGTVPVELQSFSVE